MSDCSALDWSRTQVVPWPIYPLFTLREDFGYLPRVAFNQAEWCWHDVFSSWLLTRTVLRGEVTSFPFALPPYRPPRVWQTLYTSRIDRALIVLWRAIVFAAPADAVIWLISNVQFGDTSVATHLVGGLAPVAILLCLNGVILLAYVVAIPANEIVISTITVYSICRETHSVRWTTVATMLPLVMECVLCFLLAQIWRLIAAQFCAGVPGTCARHCLSQCKA